MKYTKLIANFLVTSLEILLGLLVIVLFCLPLGVIATTWWFFGFIGMSALLVGATILLAAQKIGQRVLKISFTAESTKES